MRSSAAASWLQASARSGQSAVKSYLMRLLGGEHIFIKISAAPAADLNDALP